MENIRKPIFLFLFITASYAFPPDGMLPGAVALETEVAKTDDKAMHSQIEPGQASGLSSFRGKATRIQEQGVPIGGRR